MKEKNTTVTDVSVDSSVKMQKFLKVYSTGSDHKADRGKDGGGTFDALSLVNGFVCC